MGNMYNGDVSLAVEDIAPEGQASQTKKAVSVLFQNVSWSVGRRKNKVQLIQDVTGEFEACTLSALMGASGSGKSSLLDIFSARKTQGTIEGKIFFNGHPLSRTYARRHIGYVEQQPALIANLTCGEMLMYTAALQRPGEDANAQKERVTYIMKQLGLYHRRDVVVGNALAKGLSGGESKRVTIALGMICEPAVLFLDEPTSGLDSATANDIMTLLKNLTGKDGSMTVVTAIHSPTQYCFGLFDKLAVLANGNLAYLGPAADVEEYFLKYGSKRHFNYNTSEWLVDLITNSENMQKFTEGYKDSVLAEKNVKKTAETLAHFQSKCDKKGNALAVRKDLERVPQLSFIGEVMALLRYRAIRNYLSTDFLGARIGDKILFMGVIISLYYKAGSPSEPATSEFEAMNSVPAVLFMVVVLPAFGAAGYMPSLMLDRPIFVRERADGNYRVISYLVYKIVEELILTIPVSLLFSVSIYYGVGLHGNLPLFWLINNLNQNLGIILAYLVASFAPTVDFANALLPTYVTICLFFVGLLLPFSQIPVYWQWFSYITFLRYSWSALMMNEYEDRTMPYDILSAFSVPEGNKWAFYGYTFAFYPVFFIATFLIMWKKRYIKR